MAEILVSASTGVMNSLLGKLTTLMGEEFAKLKNLRKKVKHISDELNSMKDALERLADVDELDIQTKRWRDAVREMSYDIEDIIDDFMLKVGEKNKKAGFAYKTIQRLKTFRARHQIADRIEEIKELVRETSARRDRYKLDIPTSSDVAIDQRVIAIYANAANLVGMEEPTNEIVNWLKDEEKKVKVVSIVGFGGLGKTTLANEVFQKLEGEFDCSAFVAVSLKPNMPKLLQTLLSKVGCRQSFEDYEFSDRDLIDKIRKTLESKRYLILIDDLWDVPAWDAIKCVFPENNFGSRVIVTTRINNVAEACCSRRSECIFKMKPLSDEDSRKLFFDRIFGSEKACPSQLRDASVEILKKCGGLPLAVISISSLLASDSSNQKERWEHVQNSLGSISGTNLTLEAMRQILNLSYRNLPHHLKTCFLYLGIYPEDYEINSFKLVRLWIGEGFVSKAQRQTAKQIGTSYFNELVNRSLIQPVRVDTDGSVQTCKLHDMLLDFILHKSAEENFITVIDNPPEVSTGQPQKPRRMLFNLVAGTLPVDLIMSQVRSFAIFRSSMNIPSLTEFKYLRVLVADFRASSADGNQKIDLTGLCKLYQLRHLSISGCRKCQIPTQISGLQRLETFDIDDKSYIPEDILRVPRLLHLHIRDWSSGKSEILEALTAPAPPPILLTFSMRMKISRVPSWFRVLHNLQESVLRLLKLDKDGVSILAELPALIHLFLRILEDPEEIIVIYGTAFAVLKHFTLGCHKMSHLTFQAGAMPKLQSLRLNQNAKEWKQDHGPPTGIEHLLALDSIHVSIGSQGATESEERRAESAFRSAINMHPGHPHVQIKCQKYMQYVFS